MLVSDRWSDYGRTVQCNGEHLCELPLLVGLLPLAQLGAVSFYLSYLFSRASASRVVSLKVLPDSVSGHPAAPAFVPHLVMVVTGTVANLLEEVESSARDRG